MSYSESFPTQRPIFTLDAANAGRLDSRISYSRSTTGSFYGKNKHLSSENLIINSDASDWYSAGVEYSKATGQTGPDGSADATKFTEQASGSREYKIQSGNFTPIANQEITYSVWLKQSSGSRDYQQIRVGNIGSGQAWATFNLTNGTVDQYGGALGVSASVNTGPTDWYQCVLRFTPTSTTALSVYIYAASASGGELPNVTGDTGNSYLLFGAQVSTTGETVVNATSGQIHRAYAPTLQTAAINAPRFEYSPTDSASMGLLVEGQAQNLISYSESFSNQTINNSTLTEGAAVGPDGTLNANLLVPTSTGATGRSVNLDDGDDISHTSGNNYAFSIFAKAAGYNYLQWVGLAYFGSTYCNFDLSNGTVGNKSGSVTGSVESVGNGWYRLTVVAPATTTNNTASKGQWQIVGSSTSGRATGFTGNDYSGVLLTMAQCELSSFSSSYIKSDSGSAAGTTRAADSASMDLTQAGFNGGPFSIVSETEGGQGVYPRAWTLTDGTLDNRLTVYRNSGTATTSTNWFYYGASEASAQVSSSVTGSASAGKLAISYDTNDVSFCASGGSVTNDTSAVIPKNITTLIFGSQANGTANKLNGHIKRIAVFGEALSDSNLQSLTK